MFYDDKSQIRYICADNHCYSSVVNMLSRIVYNVPEFSIRLFLDNTYFLKPQSSLEKSENINFKLNYFQQYSSFVASNWRTFGDFINDDIPTVCILLTFDTLQEILSTFYDFESYDSKSPEFPLLDLGMVSDYRKYVNSIYVIHEYGYNLLYHYTSKFIQTDFIARFQSYADCNIVKHDRLREVSVIKFFYDLIQ